MTRTYWVERDKEKFLEVIKAWLEFCKTDGSEIDSIWMENYEVTWTGVGSLEVGFQLSRTNNE